VNDLVDVEKLGFYKKVYVESLKYKDRIKSDYWEVILDHFRWGQFLNKNVQATYADAVVAKLAEELHLSESHLYRIMQFGRKFLTEEALEDYRKDAESAGYTLTWTHIKNNVLPDSTKRPELYGGESNVADESMRKIDSIGIEMEKLRSMLGKEQLPFDKKEEIAGCLLHAQDVIYETYVDMVPEIAPAITVERSTMYLDYVRSIPCIICDQQAQAHHVEAGGVGMKGSDYATLPLCAEHHRELHDRGDATFRQWHGIDFNVEVIKIMKRYIQAIEEDGK